MLYERMRDIDIFLLIGALSFLMQAWIMIYSVKVMRLMWSYRAWRTSWILWTIAQFIITVRRIYALNTILGECESVVMAQYSSWLIEGVMLICLSILYVLFIKTQLGIFSGMLTESHLGNGYTFTPGSQSVQKVQEKDLTKKSA